jgi:hypothetical protein
LTAGSLVVGRQIRAFVVLWPEVVRVFSIQAIPKSRCSLVPMWGEEEASLVRGLRAMFGQTQLSAHSAGCQFRLLHPAALTLWSLFYNTSMD